MLSQKKEIVNLTEPSFSKAISKGIVLVDFWAAWCAPCQMQHPILKEIAAEVGDNITIAKIEVDDNRSIAAKYGIMSIPTIIIFKDGKPVKQLVGLHPKQEILHTLKTIV